MMIYDHDRPRSYSTTDFPAVTKPFTDVVLVTSSYVYAMGGQLKPFCVVRYPLDELGFGPPESFCNLSADWGKYPEMRFRGGIPVLENESECYGINDQTQSVMSGTFDVPRGVRAIPYGIIDFVDINTGDRIGRFPKNGTFDARASSVMFLDDGSMLYFISGQVVVVPNWQDEIERGL